MRSFRDLSPQEVLALAIDVERQNEHRLRTFAELYSAYDHGARRAFTRLADEEVEHRLRLERMWDEKFGQETPRPDVTEGSVREVVEAADVIHGEHEIFDDLHLAEALEAVQQAEARAYRFYTDAAHQTSDEDLKGMYQELADLEEKHAAEVFNIVPSEGDTE